MTARRAIFWLHLGVGIGVGVIVAFLAITGTIMVFQPQLTAWAERDVRISTPAVAGTCVAPSALLGGAAVTVNRAPATLTLFADPHQPAEVSFGQNVILLVNPCTGAVLRSGASRLRGFFADVRDLHRFIAWGGVRHEGLRSVKDAGTVAFLFLLLTGLFLWLPKEWSWKHLRPTLLFRRGKKGRAREWNLHNIFGFWMAVPLILIVTTGLIMAYPWANGLLYRAAGEKPPASRGEGEAQEKKPLDRERYAMLDGLLARAKAQDSQWKSLTMRMPNQKSPAVTITIDESEGGRPQERAQLTLALKDGKVLKWEQFLTNTRGRRWRLYARFLHTGELFGLTSQVIAFFAMMAALVLVWTGFSLAVRRLGRWQESRRVAAKGSVRTKTLVS